MIPINKNLLNNTELLSVPQIYSNKKLSNIKTNLNNNIQIHSKNKQVIQENKNFNIPIKPLLYGRNYKQPKININPYKKIDTNINFTYKLISIIIPVFNAEKTISRCLDSIINQVYKDWECIIINDGSTDNSLAICEEYHNKDERFKIISTENKGVSAARNIGIKESAGEYICFVDADDTLNPNKLDITYKLSQLNDTDIVYHSINVFVNDKFKTIWDNTYEGIIDIDNIVNIQYYFSNVLTKLYKASLIKDNNIQFDINCNFGEDTLFNIALVFKAKNILLIKQPLYNYNYMNNDSLSTNKVTNTRFLGLLKAYKKLVIPDKYKPIFNNYINEKAYRKDAINNIDYVFPYVDNKDPNWIKIFNEYTKGQKKDEEINGDKRFNSNEELLKFKFRAIEKYMPWINIIHFIVQSESQIPKWLDRNKVNIVYHDEIIPKEQLPTFNSSTIEMYINNIVGLSNKFIYGNDDTFPNNKLSPSDFFTKDNKIITNIHKRKFYDMNWYHMLRNSMALIYKLCNITSYRRNYIDSPNHVDVPMIRDNNIELYNNQLDVIYKSSSMFRQNNNFSQFIWVLYSIYKKGGINKKMFNMKTLIINEHKQELIKELTISNSVEYLCINDNEHNTQDDYNDIVNVFNKKYPNKSKFEI